MTGRNFISILSIGITVLLLSASGRGQSCPEIPNVASVCESATYTGARVLMDTSTFTETVDDCSCSFTTTADMIRIVTYAAPNYQQCNSAIRLFSSSGNAMRFQCLMSGTYLDTTAHKTGGAEFETFGQMYDKNYCLVLEHLGSDTDTITLTCYARNTTRNDTTTENPSIYTTQTPDDIFTTTTTTTAPRYVPERTQSVTNIMPTYTSEPSTILNQTVLTDVPSVSIVNDDTNRDNSTLTPDMGTISFDKTTTEVINGTSSNEIDISISSDNQTKHTSDISDTFASSHVISLPNNLELVENRTSDESMTNNQTQHTSETSESFPSSHILSLPNNITEVQNETSNSNATTLTNITVGSANLTDMISFDNTRDIITFAPNTDDRNEFANVRNNITFDTENATNNSQKRVSTTVQINTIEPEMVEQTDTQIDNATTSTGLSDQIKTSKTTMSTDMRSTFHDDVIPKEMFTDNVLPERSTSLNDIVHKDEFVSNMPISNEASLPANTNKTTESTVTLQLDSRPREESMFDSAPDQILQSTTPTTTLGLNFALTNITINNDRFTSDENARQKFGNDTSLGKTFGHNAMLTDSPVNETNMISDNSNDKSELFGNTLHEIDPYVKAMGLINATETPESDNRATFGNDGISIENSTASLTSERMFFVDDTLFITAPANNGKTENNSSNLIDHNQSTFGPDAVPAERSTYGLDTVTWDKSTNMLNLKHTTNDSAIDGSVIETKTVNIKMETTTGAMIDEMSLLTNLKMESSLLDNLIDTQNTENSNTTSETNSNIERSTFGSDAIPIDSMSRFDPDMSLSQITAGVNNNILEANTSRSYNESDDSKDNFRFDMANAVDNTSDTDMQSTIQGGAVTAETNNLLIKSENLVNRVGMDVLSTDDTMVRSDAMTKTQTFDFPSSERSSFGPDMVTSSNDIGSVTTERPKFGSDMVSTNDVDLIDRTNEGIKFGQDAILRDGITSKPDGATVGPGGAVSDGITTGPERSTFGPDVKVGDRNTNGPERATFGPDGIVSSDVTAGPERATFGPDGIVSSDVTTGPERATFGPDGIVSSDVTTGPERATFGPDGIVSSDVTTGPERATFGPDGIVSSDVTTGPERATFGPDGIVSSDVSTGPERATFGPDGIVSSDVSTGPERATFGQDVIPIDGNPLLPGRATFGHDNLLGDGITNGPHRNSFGQDTLLRDARVSGTVSDLLSLSNQSTVDIVSLNEVNDPSIQRDNIEQTTNRIVLGDGMITRKIFTDGPELVSDQTTSDAAKTIQTTPTPTSDDMSSDVPVTRVVFGEFVERRKLFTSTESILRDMGDTPSIPPDFVNTLNENTASAFDRRLLNDPLLQEEMTTQNVSDNQNAFNDIMATMSSVVNEPIIEETLSSKADTSLLNSVQRPKQNDPSSLFNSIWNTVNEFISNSTSNDKKIAADGLNTTLIGSAGNETQEGMATTTQNTVTDTVTGTHGSSTDTSVDLSTVIDGLSSAETNNMLIKSTTSDSLVTQADNQLTTTVAPSINETIMTETTTNMDVSTRVLMDVTTTEVRETPTTTLTPGTVPTEIIVTKSTLPPIIPADREVVPVNIVRDEVASVIEPARTTQKPRRRTTKGPYNIMVDEPVLHNDRTDIDSGGVSRTDQDQLNVSLEDEPNKSLFDVNNKTYIIVVIAVAGFIILVAIVAIIIRNRRKSNEVKSEMNNGSSATNHNNAAFDASDAERGTAAPTTNGVDPPKPTVEVIEPPNADL